MKNKTNTGALSKSAGFPGKDMVAGESDEDREARWLIEEVTRDIEDLFCNTYKSKVDIRVIRNKKSNK